MGALSLEPPALTPCALFLFVLSFLGPLLQHMDIPKLGVESELQLLGGAGDQTCVLMDTSWLRYR